MPLVVFEINAPLIPKNDVTELKARLLYLPVKKLLTVSETDIKLLTAFNW